MNIDFQELILGFAIGCAVLFVLSLIASRDEA